MGNTATGSNVLAGINAVQLQGYPVSATAPTSTYVLTWNGSAWVPTAPSGGGGNQFVICRCRYGPSTSGGTTTSGLWETLAITEIIYDGTGGASLTSNQITLPAGDYLVDGTVLAFLADEWQARLQNVTDSTTLGLGTAGYGAHNAGFSNTMSRILDKFTVAASKALEFQRQVTNAGGTVTGNGGGEQGGGFQDNIYTTAIFTKV